MKESRVWLTALVLALVCTVCLMAGTAFAEDKILDTEIAHGDPVRIQYDLSDYEGYEFDQAQLIVRANYGTESISAYYTYDPILVPAVSGTYEVPGKYTEKGSSLQFEIQLLNEKEDYLAADYFMGGSVSFTDDWELIDPVEMMVSYQNTTVQTGEKIRANYSFTGGSGKYEDVTVGWLVTDADFNWIAATPYESGSVNGGTLEMEQTAAVGKHFLQAGITDVGTGWRYYCQVSENAIEVTGEDKTSEPFSAKLTWTDVKGRELDWSRDKAYPGQTINLSWELSGGYTNYSGQLRMWSQEGW